jgi:hypothetical protein
VLVSAHGVLSRSFTESGFHLPAVYIRIDQLGGIVPLGTCSSVVGDVGFQFDDLTGKPSLSGLWASSRKSRERTESQVESVMINVMVG